MKFSRIDLEGLNVISGKLPAQPTAHLSALTFGEMASSRAQTLTPIKKNKQRAALQLCFADCNSFCFSPKRDFERRCVTSPASLTSLTLPAPWHPPQPRFAAEKHKKQTPACRLASARGCPACCWHAAAVFVCSGPGAWASSRSRARRRDCSRHRTWRPPRRRTRTDTSGEYLPHCPPPWPPFSSPSSLVHHLHPAHGHEFQTPGRFCFHSSNFFFFFNFYLSHLWCGTIAPCMQTNRPQRVFFCLFVFCIFLHRNRIKKQTSQTCRMNPAQDKKHRSFCVRICDSHSGSFSRRMFSLQTHCVCVCVCCGCYARRTGRRSVVILKNLFRDRI